MRKLFKDGWKALNRGNLWILATGLLIGAAFGAVVTSLANDVIMQAIAKVAKVDGVKMLSVGTTKWVLDSAGHKIEPLDGIMYGKFLSALFAFIIIMAFVFIATIIIMFIYRKLVHKNKEATIPAGPTTEQLMLEELKLLNARLQKLEEKPQGPTRHY